MGLEGGRELEKARDGRRARVREHRCESEKSLQRQAGCDGRDRGSRIVAGRSKAAAARRARLIAIAERDADAARTFTEANGRRQLARGQRTTRARGSPPQILKPRPKRLRPKSQQQPAATSTCSPFSREVRSRSRPPGSQMPAQILCTYTAPPQAKPSASASERAVRWPLPLLATSPLQSAAYRVHPRQPNLPASRPCPDVSTRLPCPLSPSNPPRPPRPHMPILLPRAPRPAPAHTGGASSGGCTCIQSPTVTQARSLVQQPTANSIRSGSHVRT